MASLNAETYDLVFDRKQKLEAKVKKLDKEWDELTDIVIESSVYGGLLDQKRTKIKKKASRLKLVIDELDDILDKYRRGLL